MPKTLQFSEEVFKHELMKTVIAANLPFRTLEHHQFHHMLNLLLPNTHIPSPTTIQWSIHDYRKKVHQKLKKALQ